MVLPQTIKATAAQRLSGFLRPFLKRNLMISHLFSFVNRLSHDFSCLAICTKEDEVFCMFWENFSYLCSRAGLSPNAVAKELGIPSGSITAWSKGAVPRNSTIKKIAEHFGVTTDFLISDKKEKPTIVSDDELSESKRDMINLLRSLSPEEFEKKEAALRAILDL